MAIMDSKQYHEYLLKEAERMEQEKARLRRRKKIFNAILTVVLVALFIAVALLARCEKAPEQEELVTVEYKIEREEDTVVMGITRRLLRVTVNKDALTSFHTQDYHDLMRKIVNDYTAANGSMPMMVYIYGNVSEIDGQFTVAACDYIPQSANTGLSAGDNYSFMLPEQIGE